MRDLRFGDTDQHGLTRTDTDFRSVPVGPGPSVRVRVRPRVSFPNLPAALKSLPVARGNGSLGEIAQTAGSSNLFTFATIQRIRRPAYNAFVARKMHNQHGETCVMGSGCGNTASLKPGEE